MITFYVFQPYSEHVHCKFKITFVSYLSWLRYTIYVFPTFSMFIEMEEVFSNFSKLKAEMGQVRFSNAKCGFYEYCILNRI